MSDFLSTAAEWGCGIVLNEVKGHGNTSLSATGVKKKKKNSIWNVMMRRRKHANSSAN